MASQAYVVHTEAEILVLWHEKGQFMKALGFWILFYVAVRIAYNYCTIKAVANARAHPPRDY